MLEKEAVKERREFNRELYDKIFSITGKPKKILDIGCGLNPVYFPYRDIEYIALDKNKEVLKKVKQYFKKNKIKGCVVNSDILNFDFKIGADVCFAFKVFDYLDRRDVKLVLDKINADYIVVSFATRTVTGKRMREPRREWFEKIVKIHKVLRFHNEIFYIIKKV
ncbi:MAG: hypothetical protein AABX08_04445 [Nanoarchaeota archaeon]